MPAPSLPLASALTGACWVNRGVGVAFLLNSEQGRLPRDALPRGAETGPSDE